MLGTRGAAFSKLHIHVLTFSGDGDMFFIYKILMFCNVPVRQANRKKGKGLSDNNRKKNFSPIQGKETFSNKETFN
jgi:hypothetical protein